MPGCRQYVSGAHIHPGHLIQIFPRRQKSVLLHADSELCAFLIFFYDPFHHRIDLTHKIPVLCPVKIKVYAVDKKESCVHRIVHGIIFPFREKIRHQTVLFIAGKCSQNRFCLLIPGGGKTDSRKSDHRISPPVFKKRKSCEDGLSAGRLSLSKKLVCALCKKNGCL